MRIRHHVAAAFLCCLLSACATFGLAPAKSLSDRLAYGYATLSAVQYAAATATTAGELSYSDAEDVLKLADQSRALLDGAKAILATEPEAAATKLNLAVTILTQLQAHLRSKA
jgi:hypothetical protein